MEKYLVFILLTLFFNNWMTPVSSCKFNFDCGRGLHCCKQIKSCRSSCDDVVCSSDGDCGSPSSKCCPTRKRCTPITRTRCGSESDGLTTGAILLIVFVPLGGILFCLFMAWLDKGNDSSGSGFHMTAAGGGGGGGDGGGGGGGC